MKKYSNVKKVLLVLLCAAMMVSYMSYVAFASPEPDEEGNIRVSSWDEMDAAISNIADGKTITLDDNLTADDDQSRFAVVRPGVSFTVDLAGHTIDRNLSSEENDDNEGHVFDINMGTVTITDSAGGGKLTGGSDENGGAVVIGGEGALNIENVEISGNRSTDEGGAIFVYGKMNMTNCVVSGNTSESGGGIFIHEGAEALLTTVTIQDNSAAEWGGGGINNKGTATLSGCTISGNSAGNEGGGIYNGSGSLTLTDCSLSGNYAPGGGGICCYGTVNMTGGSVTGNTAADGAGVYNIGGSIQLSGVTISGNNSTEQGGAGLNTKNQATITDCTIKDNTAAADGGGIYAEGTLTMTGGSITGNAAGSGGGIRTEGAGEITLNNVTITGNSARVSGGGIDIQNSKVTMGECVFSANTAAQDGGGIYCCDSSVTFNNGQITSNSAESAGGGIRIYGGAMEVTGSSITDNLSKGYGGGAYVDNDNGVLTLRDTVIEDNEADELGGGIFLGKSDDPATVALGGRVIVENNGSTDVYLSEGRVLTIIDTFTEESSVGVIMEADEGVFTSGLREHSDGHDADSYFTPNKDYTVLTDGNGEGKIAASEWPQLQQQIDRAPNGAIINLEKDWTAVQSDVALVIPEGKQITIDLKGHIIDRNLKDYKKDGNVMTVYGDLTIRDTEPTGGGKITGGCAGDPEWVPVDGGGIQNHGTLTLEGGEITGNNCDGSGSGIFNSSKGTLNIKGGAVCDNTCRAIRNEGTMNMSGGVISGHHVYGEDQDGGGLDCYSGTFTMTGGIIRDNAADLGGGILASGGNIIIRGGEISGNKADEGGGIYCMEYAWGTVALEGGSITGNEAENQGGGIYFSENTWIEVKGSPVVNGNKAAAANNLRLDKGDRNDMHFTGKLGENSRLDITASHAKGVITSGLTTSGSAAYAEKIFTYSGKSDLLEIRDDGELYLKVTADRWVDSWEDLQAAVNDAGAGEVIAFSEDLIAHGKERILVQDKELTLDLCGYSFRREQTVDEKDHGGLIIEAAGSTDLTIRDSADCGFIGGGYTEGDEGNGGSIRINKDARCTIYGTEIRRGYAESAGGGIYVAGTLNMQGGEMLLNTAGGQGGGIYCEAGGTVELTDTLIDRNTSSDCGGIYNAGGTVVLNHVTIRNNEAGSQGGAGLNNKGSAVLTDCTISGNSCGDHGAGIYNEGPLTVTNGTITGNSGQAGAGLFTNSGEVILDSITLSNNSSSDYGGAVYAWDGKVTISNCTITGNSCKKGGAGITARCEVNVTDTMITSNTADESGGALYVYMGRAKLSDVRMIDNKAGQSGGAVFLTEDGSLELAGSAEKASSDKYGTILTGNQADSKGGAMFLSDSAKEAWISGYLTVLNNQAGTGDDVLLSAGKKLTLIGTLAEGTNIHVSLEENIEDVSAEFTSDFAKYMDQTDPSRVFDPDDGFSVQRSAQGEAVIHASEWPLLQKKIDAAIDLGTIQLDKDYKAVASDGALKIQGKRLTIDLNGHTIDRSRNEIQDGGEVIHVDNNADLTITDSTGRGKITGGQGNNGGGVVNEGKLSFAGGSITGCKAVCGAGIYSTGALTVRGGSISGNDIATADGSGGGIYSGGALEFYGGEISGNTAGTGGGIYHFSGPLTMSGGIIANNRIEKDGGGIYISDTSGSVKITGGSICGNSSVSGSGGGIYSRAELALTGVSITGNSAAADGGGLLIAEGTTGISSGSITGNKAGTPESSITDDSGKGGAVFLEGGELELFGGSLQGNEAQDAGGAIMIRAGTLKVQGTPVVNGNLAPSGKNILLGGNEGDSRKIVIVGKLTDEAKIDLTSQDPSQPLTSGFKASGSGMGVFSYNENSGAELIEKEDELYLKMDADVWVSDWTALQNAVGSPENQGKVIALSNNITAGDDDDRILLNGNNVTVDLCGHTLDRHRDDSDEDGHVFEVIGGSTLTIRDTAGTGLITGGWANNGGAINIAGDAICNIEGGTIRGNKAERDGGGIYVYGTLNMTRGTVTGNSSDENGGGIYLDEESSPEAELKNVIISRNESGDCGGLYVFGKAVLENVRIENNSALERGGAGINNKGDASLKDCIIRENGTDDNGAGIYTEGTLDIEGGSIDKNNGNAGAGLFINSGKVTLKSLTVSGNTSGDVGGGIYNKGELTGTDVTVKDNTAKGNGGGVYSEGTTNMTGGMISSNTTEKSGGAVSIQGGSASFTSLSMTDNAAGEHGGGIYCTSGGSCSLSVCTISANHAGGNGGGLLAGEDAGAVNISGKISIEQNSGTGNVHLGENRKLTLTGPLSSGSNIGVTLTGAEADKPFTEGFYSFHQNMDPSVYFFSDDDLMVYLLSGEAAMKADVDQEKSFIEKNSSIKEYSRLNSQSWMAGISGERYINEINLPGTHDSSMTDLSGKGTAIGAAGNSFAKTQNSFIDEQMDNGIRRLDLRLINDYCKHDYVLYKSFEDDGKNLWTCHGKTSMGTYYALDHVGDLLSLDEVLGWVKSFLEDHPTETVLIGFTAETDDDEVNEKVMGRLRKILRKLSYETNPSTGKTYIYMENDVFGGRYTHYPKLKDCRGQFLIMADEEDTEIIGGGTTDMFGTVTEYEREGGYKQNSSQIISSVEEFYEKYGGRPLPTTADVHIDYLYKIGLNGTAEDANILDIPTPPLWIADDIHSALFGDGDLFDQNGYYLGFINQDGETAHTTGRLWRSNFFDGLEYCTVTVDPGFDTDTYPIRKYLLLKNTEITIPECIYANPDPEGSFFEGWEAGGTTYLADQKYKVTGDVTFKAKWGTDMHTPLRVVWYDADDKDKLRAESLQIELRGQTDLVTISAENGWIAMLTGDIDQVKPIWPERIIPSSNAPQGRDKAGQYRYEVEGNMGTGFTIRLYHTPKDTVPVSGAVTWEDGDNKEGDRPDNVTLRLYADGKEQQDITVTASGNWKWDLGKLPEYKDGREISYTLTEDSIDKYIDEVNGLNVTNTHAVDSRHVSVAGQIVWNDDEDALKRRPDKVTLHLKKNGKEIASKVVEPDQEGYWFWNFYVVAGKNEDLASAVFSVTQDDLIDYDTATKTDEDYGYLVVVNTYNAHTHQPAEAVKENETAATCEDAGSYDSVVYCTICGEEISREKITVPALGHNWSKWTSEDDIHHKRICANDSTHVQMAEHGFDDGVVTKEATRTSTGIMTYTCEECGYSRNEIIPKKGSDPDQKGTDGTAVGPGASYASAERAILSMKNDKDPAGTVFSKLRFRSTVQKKKSIRLRWNKPKSARLFVVYGNRCGKKYRMKKLKTLTGTTLNVKKIGGKNLKKGTSYKFIIIALDKDYNVVSTSKVIHAATKGGRLTNYKSVKTSKKSKILFIRKGRHAWILGSGVKERRLLRVSIHRGIRYESSSTAIAAVSRIGRVEARKRGVCYYYAYTQNGVYRRIKIIVI